MTLVQTSEVAVKIDDGDKVEEVRAAFEAEVCAGDDSCSVVVVDGDVRRLRARALDFSTAALTGAESDATSFTLRIVRELSGADSLAAPQLDKRMLEETLEAAAGTGVEIGAAPAVTKLEAAVATTVEGADGAARARARGGARRAARRRRRARHRRRQRRLLRRRGARDDAAVGASRAAAVAAAVVLAAAAAAVAAARAGVVVAAAAAADDGVVAAVVVAGHRG